MSLKDYTLVFPLCSPKKYIFTFETIFQTFLVFRIARLRKSDYLESVGFGTWRSPASALAWGARGRGFKSRRPDE